MTTADQAEQTPGEVTLVTPVRHSYAMALAACLVVLVGGAFVYDPWAPAGCPGALASGADCARYGGAGRLYAAILMVRANSALNTNQPDTALATIDPAVSIRPNFVFAYNSQGLAYAQAGDHARAIAAYDHSLSLGPSYLKARVNRAVSHQALGDKAAAARDFAAVYEAGPAASEDLRAYARAMDRSS